MSDTDSSYDSECDTEVDHIPEHLLDAAHEACDRRLARAEAGPQLPLGRTTPNAKIILRRHLLRPRRTVPEYGSVKKHRLTSRCWVPLQSPADITGTCYYPPGPGPHEHPRRTWVQWADQNPVIELSDGSFFLLHPLGTTIYSPSAWSCCSFSFLYLWRVFTTAFPRLAFGLYTSPLEPTQLRGRAISYDSFCRRLNGDRNWKADVRRVLFTATVYPPVASFITPVPRLYTTGATPAAADHTRVYAGCISHSEQSLPSDWTPSSRYEVAEARNRLHRSYTVYLAELLRDTCLQAGAPGEAPAVPLVVLHHRAANQARKGLQDSWDLEFEFSAASDVRTERARLRSWVPPPLPDEPPASSDPQLRQRVKAVLEQLQAADLPPPSLPPIVLGVLPHRPREPPAWTPWHYSETPVPIPPGFTPILFFGATPTRYPDTVAWTSAAPSPPTPTAPSSTEVSLEDAIAANLAALSTYASAPRLHVLLTRTRQGRQRVLSGDRSSPAAAPAPTAGSSSPSSASPSTVTASPARALPIPVVDYRPLNREYSAAHEGSDTRSLPEPLDDTQGTETNTMLPPP